MNGYYPEGASYVAQGSLSPLPTLSRLEYLMKEGRTLEAPVILCDNEMNLHVRLGGGLIGIIPREEAVYAPTGEEVKDIAILTRVGKPVCFKIQAIDRAEPTPRILLSRRAAQKECCEAYISTLRPGDVIRARVTHMESFGAFLDIGCGIVALLTIDCLSVSRISHPCFRLSIGEDLDVVVRTIDENGRIYVSRKELLGTWEENAALFSPGQTVPGVVRGIEDYGIFVELTPNLAGLAEVRGNVAENQSAIVYIKSIIPEKMKIKLVIIDTCESDGHRRPAHTFSLSGCRHIDRWQYSPAAAHKLIETVFTP